jgi:hypothetical protein
LAEFSKQVFKNCVIRGLVHGNLTEADAQFVANDLLQTLNPTPLPPAEIPVHLTVAIPTIGKAFFRFLLD